MGQRQAKLARDRAASGAGAGSGSGSDGGHRQAGDDAGAREVAPPEMLVFLETAPGITWLGDILLDLPASMHNLRATTLAELNNFVIRKYKDFIKSDIGHRMIRSPQQKQVAQQDTLALPAFIIEDLVRQRLRTNITSHYWSTGVFLATRAPLMCGAVHFLKHLIHQHVLRPRRNGRHRRLVRAAAFVLDQLLPTAFYGPLLTYGLLARKMVNQLEE